MNQNGFHLRRTAGFEPHVGGTALGGPSGNDDDGSFDLPYGGNVAVNTHVNEFGKDDHSINIKDKHVYEAPKYAGPPIGPGAGPFPHHAFGPGAGPFPKRSWGQGGTAMGGPSGNDEGQSFNMPITGIFNTEVNESNEDDHSIDIKNKDVHPPPIVEHVAPPHPAAEFGHGPRIGGPAGPSSHPPFRGADNQAPPEHFHIAATEFDKRFAPGGTALGGPGGGDEPGFPGPISGGTALGGPSGDDDGLNFGKPHTAHIHTNVEEYSKDDHSIDIKHKDIVPPPVFFGRPGFGAPFKRGLLPHEGGTALGGPSGDDGGQEFNMPITVETNTEVSEAYKDDHSIDLKNEDITTPPPFEPFGGPGPVLPPGGGHPWRRAYAPDASARFAGEPGGTALGGPSGDDDGINFDDGTDVGVDSNVNEHHSDNHAIKIDTTNVHPPFHVHEAPQWNWWSYEDQQAAAPAPVVKQPTGYPVPQPEHPVDSAPQPEHPAPPAPPAKVEVPAEEHPALPPREEHQEQCSAEVREVVHTVTKTQYREVQATETIYKQPYVSEAVQTAAASTAVVPMHRVHSSMVHASVPASSVSYVYVRPEGTSAMYSMIPVHVPMATPSSASYMGAMMTPVSGAPYMSMATPVSHAPNMRPSGASPEQSNAPKASPSSNTLFTGAGARISGGVVSAAAAVMGVLAFVL
ncbi:hypothetical protein N7468_006748 [Penicillium chermesinum]|uniref:GPI anchored protein n=1 Tax=Penicillium chermesinum TaxID=63820 RepID=A0A9W9NT61_9EURO|nr:uncharacterized protein N7468_006748 [Penicillium chermesinum]KAJ5225523.1 hypothetical protein N7468_006748 [Penicillium chermesinum]